MTGIYAVLDPLFLAAAIHAAWRFILARRFAGATPFMITVAALIVGDQLYAGAERR
jgi:hypothetical protein